MAIYFREVYTSYGNNGTTEFGRRYSTIDEDVVEDVIKMVIFLMCRNPDFDYLGILPRILGIFEKPLKDIAGAENVADVEVFLQLQRDAAWLNELYNGIYDVQKGYFYTMKTTAESTMQMILFKTWENQGSFITSDKPAFIHNSSVESSNMNSIICPLTHEYLVMIVKGDKNSLNDVKYRMADNDLIRKFNMMILNHSNKAIISDYKHLGYIL